MPKYKNNTPQIIEGFLEKMFGALATKTGEKLTKQISKQDPEMGKLLQRGKDLIKQAEKRLKGMSPEEKEKRYQQQMKDLGWDK
jgi:hypothetical protein